MLNRSARAGLGFAALTLTACGESTAPHTVTATQLARHIDSLTVATGGVGWRFDFLANLEWPPGYGAAPVSVVVTTGTGTSTWQGFMAKVVPDQGADSEYIIFAYSDYQLTNAISAKLRYVGGQPQSRVSVLADTSQAIFGGSGTVTAATVSTGGACTPVTGLQYFSPNTGAATCTLGLFDGMISWTFPPSTGAPAEFQTVQIRSHLFPGVAILQ